MVGRLSRLRKPNLNVCIPAAKRCFGPAAAAIRIRCREERFELAEHYGRQLAGAVDAALLTSQVTEIEPHLETSYSEIDLPLDTLPTSDELRTATNSTNRYEQARARMLLQRIESDGALDQTYPYPIGIWKLGKDVRWILLGGEVVVDYALRLKDELPGTSWVAGYTNDVMAYIPSRRVLREGGYEGATSMVYYGLPTTWSPTIEEAIVREVVQQANRGVTTKQISE